MKIGFFCFACICFCLQLFSAQAEEDWLGRDDFLVKEEFLSPAAKSFDCHSSSIVETVPGSFCAVWKGGMGEGKSNEDMRENVGIWISLFDATSWSKPKELVHVPHSVCWNPILCKLPSGELLLFYRIGPDPRRVVSFMKRSSDSGYTWTSEEILPAGIIGPTKTKPLVTSEGTLICPSSIEVGEPEDECKATACWIEISEDQGNHWCKIGPLELPGKKFAVIEPTLFSDKEGNLRMLCRNRANRIGDTTGSICQAISHDKGKHWTELQPIALPNPDSGIDVADLGGGNIILVYNHSYTDRFPLNLAVSSDGGDHWSFPPYTIDIAGEMPAVIMASDGLVHMTYAFALSENDQRRIKHVVVDPMKLFEK